MAERKWEYAVFLWMGLGPGHLRQIRFSNGSFKDGIKGTEFMPTLHQLGEDGWELIKPPEEISMGFSKPCELYFKRVKSE